MQKLRLSDLSEAVRSWLAGLKDTSVVIEDDDGHLQYGITPYGMATPEERRAAWESLEQLQLKVGESLRRHGKTEDDVMAELLKDD